jgi:hypothetical protein
MIYLLLFAINIFLMTNPYKMKFQVSVIFFLFTLIISPSFAQQAEESLCKTDENYRQFDFWIGEWDVYQNDTLAGTNTVNLILDDCVISENWQSAKSDYAGKSYNYYEPASGYWYQTWVDNKGKYLFLKGTFANKKMILMGNSFDNEGKVIYNRITYIAKKDKTVRQIWEQAKTRNEWEVVFDGLYVPKGQNPEE